MTRRLLLAGLIGLAVAAFIGIKLVSPRSRPPIEIRSEGIDRRLARNVLATALDRLFPKGNGQWQVRSTPVGDRDSRCIMRRSAYRSSTGRAVTVGYEFARWLEVRLGSYVYVDAAAAWRASSAAAPRKEYVCVGEVIAAELHREGYLVGKARVFPGTHFGDDGRSRRIEIPTRYKGRRYEWDIDSSAVRRGRIILVVGTVTARPFLQANQDMASELASAAL